MNDMQETKYSDEYDGSFRNLYKFTCSCENIRWLPLNKLKIQKYCSPNCGMHPNAQNRLTLQCGLCEKTFTRRKSLSRKSKSGLFFCSLNCLNQARRVKAEGALIGDPQNQSSQWNSTCIHCGKDKPFSKNKSCDRDCKYLTYIEKWKRGEVSGNIGQLIQSPIRYVHRYMRELYGEKCQLCNWDKVNQTTNKVPLQLNHIDGNHENTTLANLELLCPNCHALTPNFGSLNRGNGRRGRRHEYSKWKETLNQGGCNTKVVYSIRIREMTASMPPSPPINAQWWN